MLRARNYRHGFAVRGHMIAEYRVWSNMKSRCCNPASTFYENYGGRGIEVAKEWKEDFTAFLAHVGLRPSKKHQLDRINNDGNYELGNVRWIHKTENVRNTRSNINITIGGVTKCASAWDEHCGFKTGGKIVLGRLKRGWQEEQLLAPLGTVFKPRKQTDAERLKRSKTMKRNIALGLYDKVGEKIAATRRKQFAENPSIRLRDERGCFAGVARNAENAEEILRG